MELIVDYRERKLIQRLKEETDLTFEIRKLDLGDILFFNQGELILLIERKTVNDLCSSIVDGRNREQKIRLLNCGIDRSKIMYLVEGNIETLKTMYSKNVMTPRKIYGSIVNTIIRDNLKVFRTVNLKETIHLMKRIYEKLQTNPEKLLPEKTEICYASTIKRKKKENMTTDVCSLVQLSQIPSVSISIAKVVLKEYGSIYHLCQEYSKLMDDFQKCRDLLRELTIKTTHGKRRKIGSKASENIFQYLCNIT